MTLKIRYSVLSSRRFRRDSTYDELLEAMEERLPRSIARQIASAVAVKALQNAKETDAFTDRTGALRASIGVRESSGRAGREGRAFELYAKAPYAGLVERGHGGPAPAPPRPFLRPALRAAVKSVMFRRKTLVSKLEEALDTIVG